MYFSKFPVVEYPIKDGSSIRYVYARNILRRIALSENIKSGEGIFIEYSVKDGERPEHIAERIYGSPTYHWLILLSNEIIDAYHGWYKSGFVMEDYIQKKYGGYSVFITDATDGFFFNSSVVSGSTLTQGSTNQTIIDYTPTLCKMTVRGSGSLVEGTATIGLSGGGTSTIKIQRIEPSYVAVHHFEVSRPVGDCGASEEMVVDPLSQQNSSYSIVGGVIGMAENEYPTTTEGITYVGSGTVSLNETYIGKYMGIGVDAPVNLFSITNYIYENRKNDSAKTIRILHPKYKKLASEEFESLLRV